MVAETKVGGDQPFIRTIPYVNDLKTSIKMNIEDKLLEAFLLGAKPRITDDMVEYYRQYQESIRFRKEIQSRIQQLEKNKAQ